MNIIEHSNAPALQGHRLRRQFRAAYHHAGPTGTVGIVPLANYLQQAAGEHAEALGVASEHLVREGLFWVLTRLFVHVTRPPRGGQLIEIETWPSQRPRQLFLRDFRIRDADGAELVTATSNWALIDAETRKATKGPAWVAELVAHDTARAVMFPDQPPPRLTRIERDRRIAPRWSDLDINGHVNNANLIGWLLEVFEGDWLAGNSLAALDIAFRAECTRDQAARSGVTRLTANSFAHVLRRDDDAEIARARTWWQQTSA